LGGTMTLDSKVGVGTNFTVRLPLSWVGKKMPK
jgi:chemotaxis protein histidine kinase CheA